MSDNKTTIHPERGNLDRMSKKPLSVQRELEEARRIVSRAVLAPPRSEWTAAQCCDGCPDAPHCIKYGAMCGG